MKPELNTDDMAEQQLGTSNFNYSTVSLDNLNDIGTRFTLVTAVVDCSPSTSGFIFDMESCLAEVVRACKASPESDTFLFRVVRFATRMDELHGFKPLSECDESDYGGSLTGHHLGGTTSLYDATVNALEATRMEARRLGQEEFDVNAVNFNITDGLDISSNFTPAQVRKEFERLTKEEFCESVLPILIGVNVGNDTEGQRIDSGLRVFEKEGGFAQYVRLNDASSKTLADLAKFIAKSASAQSQSLGTGGASKPIDINAI